MAKVKAVAPADAVCADCSDEHPTWASINRGIFICTECCCVHRSLGRHVSQVRSLKKSYWHPSQLALLHALHACGSNNIWEHCLLDPNAAGSNKQFSKPKPRDPLYPVKADFIRAKYQTLAFALRSPKDQPDISCSRLDDLNRQLNSCVRTSHVETTLRLMVLGAAPGDFMDPESGATPIHVAAREGQALQVELLFLYGADPAQPDFEGHTPSDLASLSGHLELSRRLIELQYEATDRLSFYLCGRIPEHRNSQHFLIPEVATGQFDMNKRAKQKLQRLSDDAFEKLVQDVYDETDRRETDSAWAASLSAIPELVSERYVVPFLPVNADLAAPRNQRRQKLAKFNGREFAALLIDILNESKRRQGRCGSSEPSEATDSAEKKESMDDVTTEANVYDEVPFEQEQPASVVSVSNRPADQCTSNTDDPKALRHYILNMDQKVDELSLQNKLFQSEILYLKNTMENVMEELKALKADKQGLESVSGNANRRDYYQLLNRRRSFGTSRSASMNFAERSATNGRASHMAMHRTSLEISHKVSLPAGVQADTAAAADSLYPDYIVSQTEQLTREIQLILQAAQAEQLDSFTPLVVRIQNIVDGIVNSVPVHMRKGSLSKSLDSMVDACLLLAVHCARYPTVPGAEEPLNKTHLCYQMVQASYEVAKAAKQLIVSIQQ